MACKKFLSLVEPLMVVVDHRGGVLTQDLDKHGNVYYLIEGLALQDQAFDHEKQLALPKLPGSFIGLECLFTEGDRLAVGVTLATPAKVGVINKDTLRRFIADAPPEIYQTVAQTVSCTLIEQNNYLGTVALLNVPRRQLGYVLDLLKGVIGQPHTRGTLLTIGTGELSRLIGANEECVRRAITALIEAGGAARLGPKKLLLFDS